MTGTKARRTFNVVTEPLEDISGYVGLGSRSLELCV